MLTWSWGDGEGRLYDLFENDEQIYAGGWRWVARCDARGDVSDRSAEERRRMVAGVRVLNGQTIAAGWGMNSHSSSHRWRSYECPNSR